MKTPEEVLAYYATNGPQCECARQHFLDAMESLGDALRADRLAAAERVRELEEALREAQLALAAVLVRDVRPAQEVMSQVRVAAHRAGRALSGAAGGEG